MWTLTKTDAGWEVRDGDGTVLATEAERDAAVAALAAAARGTLATDAGAETPAGALVRWKAGPSGICLSEATGDGRDFSTCAWTHRDLPLPLMSQMETAWGHEGAGLAGWFDTLDDPTGDGGAGGWLYDNEAGRALHQVLAAQGTFGVSVDPGSVEVEFVCTDEEDGWCVDGYTRFDAYEIAGATATPFPAFARAAIVLDVAAAAPAEEPVAASAAPVAPPRAWFDEPEPDGDDPRLVRQPDGTYAVPLTVTADGQVYGHVAAWGTCHTARLPKCVTAPASTDTYPMFHVGLVSCADGTTVPTGPLTAGCDHAALTLGAYDARDWYAHSGMSWADVRASNGVHGVWVAGAVRPGVTDEQRRAMAALAPSGDWRYMNGRWEMVGVLQVNIPGFPIARVAAAGVPSVDAPVRWRDESGVTLAMVAAGRVLPDVEPLVAAGRVEPCETCGGRLARLRPFTPDPRLDRIEGMLATLLARTEPLNVAAIERLRARILAD